MKTFLEIVRLAAEFLEKKGIDQPRRQAEEVIADALGMQRMQLFLEYDRPLTEPELDACRKSLARRGEGEPAAYIRGSVEFFGCDIAVSKAVLIPRPETEILVDKIAAELSGRNLEGKELWDLCCGSGCIAIALKKAFPALGVVASDISPEALAIAQKNAASNQVEVTFLQGDLLAPFQGRKADFVVCNPPYVSEKEYRELDREVRDFEPKGALLGGADGLDCYRRLSRELPPYMNPGARVWLEIGWNQGPGATGLFQPPAWKSCRLERDWSGHDRFISLEIE